MKRAHNIDVAFGWKQNNRSLCVNCGSGEIEQEYELFLPMNFDLTEEEVWEAYLGASSKENYWCPDCVKTGGKVNHETS